MLTRRELLKLGLASGAGLLLPAGAYRPVAAQMGPGGGGGGMGGGGMGGGGGMMEMMCDPNLFPAPEVNANLTPMNQFNVMMDQPNIVDFLKTLSDGYFVR